MVEFVDKGKVLPKSGLSICEFWLDNNELGVLDLGNRTNVVMLVEGRVAEHLVVKFSHKIDVTTRYAYWLQNYLSHSGNILKNTGLYEALWVSQFKRTMNEELLKAFSIRSCPNSNSIYTCYRELEISLLEVFFISSR